MRQSQESAKVGAVAADLLRHGAKPTVREIATRLAPIGHSTVAAALREWMRASLVRLSGGNPDLQIVEEASDRRMAIQFDGKTATLFVGDTMLRLPASELLDRLGAVVKVDPERGGGLLLSLMADDVRIRLTTQEYVFLAGHVAAWQQGGNA